MDEIAFTGEKAFVVTDSAPIRQRLPLMVAVERTPVKGVITDRGTTRIIAAGDSLFLANNQIDMLADRDFAGYAVNWLLDRPELLEGIGPRPVSEFRLAMTRSQTRSAEWVLLAGMPGAVLFLGCLVWLRRR